MTPHRGWSSIPEEAAGRPVLAFVRNPWDWYVSWYSFVVNGFDSQRSWRGPLLPFFFTGEFSANANSGERDTNTSTPDDFPTTIRRACGGMTDERLAALERIGQNGGLRGPRSEILEPLREGHDFYTARLMATFGDGLKSDLLTIGCLESLAGDLESFLRRAGVKLSAGAAARIRSTERVGAGRRGPYRDYYDDELRDLVGSSCERLIEQFDYRF
jgi:hypothetical protein